MIYLFIEIIQSYKLDFSVNMVVIQKKNLYICKAFKEKRIFFNKNFKTN